MGKKKKDGKKDKSAKKAKLAEAGGKDLATALTQAARSLRTEQSHQLAACGLYAGQEGVILALASEDGLTAGAIAQRLGVKAPTMTRTIGRMEAQGFVTRGSDGGDGRLTKVFLTDAGRNTVEGIEQALKVSEKRATKGLSNKDIRALTVSLMAVTRNLDPDEADDQFD